MEVQQNAVVSVLPVGCLAPIFHRQEGQRYGDE